jgi:hypothetical protein
MASVTGGSTKKTCFFNNRVDRDAQDAQCTERRTGDNPNGKSSPRLHLQSITSHHPRREVVERVRGQGCKPAPMIKVRACNQ